MTVRPAPLLAALALLTSPALAQESAEEAPADDSATAVQGTAVAPPPAAPAAEPEAPESTPAPAPSAPSAPAIAAPQTIVASPFSPDQRNGWLTQCRIAFLRAGAALGGANGLPDACETQLIDFERSYVPTADGQPPVIWVRVPVARPAAAVPPPAESPEE
jgi:hypothetical protein